MDKLISVIMPCFNEKKEFFEEAVDSILNQTYKNLELIIVLDNPHNEILKHVALEYSNQDNRVRFYVNDKNLGLVNNLNHAITLAKGDIIGRLDADDIASKNRFEEQIKYIEEYDIVSSNFAFISEEGSIIRHRVFPSEFIDVENYLLKNADCMYHTTWLIKKEVYYKLNFYRNIGPFEDYDLLLRALKQGFKLFNTKDELNFVRINPDGISITNKVLQHLGSEYIREHADEIDSITKDNIKSYLSSEIGKKHIDEYKRFCKITSKFYSSKSTVEFYLKLVLYGWYLALFNYYGRKKIINRFK